MMSDLRILVVEDTTEWQGALKEYLLLLSDEVQVLVKVASSYIEALHYVNKEIYDLIIVDLALKGIPLRSRDADEQGLELLQVVRETQNNKHCGVIVLTAFGNIDRVKQAFRDYHVYDFLEKENFDVDHFLEIARTAIRDARLSQAEAKAREGLRLIVTFNQERLVDSELTGSNRHAVYSANNRRRFRAADLIQRADKINTLVITGNADIWRPEVRSLGKTIRDILVKEECFQRGLIEARAVAKHPGDLWLQFSGPAMGLGIPFELLYTGEEYLGRMHILTRQLIQPKLLHKTEPFHVFLTGMMKRQETLRILIVGANVHNNIPAAEREATALKTTIESNLRLLSIPCDVDLLLGTDASYEKVSDALRNGRYHIFHYAGHGLYDEALPEISGLVLHKNNSLRVLTAADLNTLVSDTELHLVFLSCCLGARNASHVGRGDFYGMMEALVSADVPTVLGYRWSVKDNAAQRLAQVFYEELWRTFAPGEALLEARISATLGTKGLDDETWASPVLVMQNV